MIDHAIPKILRAVNLMTLNQKLDDDKSDPTVADMLGVLPKYTCSSNTSTGTSRGSTQSWTSFSLSLSRSAEKDQLCKPIKYFQHEIEADDQAAVCISASYSKASPCDRDNIFYYSPRKSSANAFEVPKTKSCRSIFHNKRGMNFITVVVYAQRGRHIFLSSRWS